jgi:hypothetical protein
MCNPTLIASAAAQGVGAMIQNQAANRMMESRKAYIDQDMQRRTAKEQEARTAIDQSTDMMRRDKFDAGMDEQTARLQNLYNKVTGRNIIPTATSDGVPQLIKRMNENELNMALNRIAQDDKNLAKLNSFGTFLSDTISPQLTSSGLTSQMMGNFMKGDSVALGTELDAANRQAYSPLAQILMAGGRVGTSYGLMK